MRQRIPDTMNNKVYEFYDRHINTVGTPITSIAELFNKANDTNFAESSLRNRYQKVLLMNLSDTSVEEMYALEQTLSKKEGRIIAERQKLNRMRSSLSYEIKKSADKSLVAEIFKEIWGEVEVEPSISTIVEDKPRKTQTFLYGDAHMGYEYEGAYSVEIAISRLEEVYGHISTSIKEDTEFVRIGDLADHIEGRGLRITQLATTSIDMAEQSKIYIDVTTKLLMQLSEAHPNVIFEYCIVSDDNHSQLRLYGSGRNELTDNLAKFIAHSIKQTFTGLHYGGKCTNMTIIHGDNIIIEHSNGLKGIYTHGHQYSADDKVLLKQVKSVYGDNIAYVVRAHFHRFSMSTQEVNQDTQVSIITIPAVVGRSDYSDRLFLSSHSGLVEFYYDEEDGLTNARVIRLKP